MDTATVVPQGCRACCVLRTEPPPLTIAVSAPRLARLISQTLVTRHNTEVLCRLRLPVLTAALSPVASRADSTVRSCDVRGDIAILWPPSPVVAGVEPAAVDWMAFFELSFLCPQIEHHLFPRMSSAWYPYIRKAVMEVIKASRNISGPLNCIDSDFLHRRELMR
jgi:hypothetical protein